MRKGPDAGVRADLAGLDDGLRVNVRCGHDGGSLEASPTIARVTADVVIPTWRASDLLRRCLFALRADHSSKRVIVVDNASGDGTAAFVRGEFPEVTLVELPENVGFGRAVNAGARVG